MEQFTAENLCGTRSHLLQKRLRAFFQRLKNAGAKLVFFDENRFVYKPLHDQIMRRTNRYRQHNKFLSACNEGVSLSRFVENHPKSGFVNTGTQALVREVALQFGPLFFSFNEPKARTVARYAAENNGFVVISNNCDKIIYESIKKIWLSDSINFEMAVFDDLPLLLSEVKSESLVKEFGLSPGEETALFASVAGNDFLKRDFQQHFKADNRLQLVADYVLSLKSLKSVDEKISVAAYHIASSTHKADKKEEIAEALRLSMDSYRVDKEPEPVKPLDPFLQKLEKEEENLHFAILADRPIEVCLIMEDQR